MVVSRQNHVEKPISQIQISDTVLSWDDQARRLTGAKVIGIDIFNASELLEITLNDGSASLTAVRESHQQTSGGPQQAGMKSLGALSSSIVVTKDHPIFSVRANGLVSKEPNETRELYGLSVTQMLDRGFSTLPRPSPPSSCSRMVWGSSPASHDFAT